MEESMHREERNLETIAEERTEETAEDGIVCTSCKAPFSNVNEIYHCPTHPEILMHDDCGNCTLLGCSKTPVQYLNERSSQNVAQNINTMMKERNYFASDIRAFASSTADKIRCIIANYKENILTTGAVAGIIAGVIGILAFGAYKLLHRDQMRPITGQVTYETYYPETDSTKEIYIISLQGTDRTHYEITVFDAATMTKKELADRIKTGNIIRFPQGIMESEEFSTIEYETDFTPEDITYGFKRGFKRADRITIANEAR